MGFFKKIFLKRMKRKVNIWKNSANSKKNTLDEENCIYLKHTAGIDFVLFDTAHGKTVKEWHWSDSDKSKSTLIKGVYSSVRDGGHGALVALYNLNNNTILFYKKPYILNKNLHIDLSEMKEKNIYPQRRFIIKEYDIDVTYYTPDDMFFDYTMTEEENDIFYNISKNFLRTSFYMPI